MIDLFVAQMNETQPSFFCGKLHRKILKKICDDAKQNLCNFVIKIANTPMEKLQRLIIRMWFVERQRINRYWK